MEQKKENKKEWKLWEKKQEAEKMERRVEQRQKESKRTIFCELLGFLFEHKTCFRAADVHDWIKGETAYAISLH